MSLTRWMLLTVVICAASSASEQIIPPDYFVVDFHTDIAEQGSIISIEVNRSWAPIAADHFFALIEDSFYDGAAFFRVVPDFVLQFGIAGTPAENLKWSKPIADEPVLQSNTAGMISYATAGPNTRTTQLFINYVDNPQLNSMGFTPFAKVTTGLNVAKDVYNPTPGSSNGINQDDYTNGGDTWIRKNYPKVNFILKAIIR